MLDLMSKDSPILVVLTEVEIETRTLFSVSQ